MKIPTTFLPERKNLEEKTLELAKSDYKGISFKKQALLEENFKEEYYKELQNNRRGIWTNMRHLDKPGTKDTCPIRGGLTFGALFVALLTGGIVSSYTNYIPFLPSVIATFGSLPVLYRGLSEIIVRYDTRKKCKR